MFDEVVGISSVSSVMSGSLNTDCWVEGVLSQDAFVVGSLNTERSVMGIISIEQLDMAYNSH